MDLVNRQFRLAARPEGLPKPSDWNLTEEAVPDPADGQVVVRTSYVSLDPAMRGWMSARRSYIRPVEIGDVMRALGAGEVVASEHPALAPGDQVTGMLGVQEYAVVNGGELRAVDTSFAPLSVYLGALGMPGMTAYFGMLDIGRPAEGDTVLVSGAAGAVGGMAGQIAKLRGARVIGVAGGPAKCAHCREELGFDATIDYREGDVGSALAEHCPRGIDVFFDNVGGAILDAALLRLARYARVVVCGAISQYNTTGAIAGPSNYLALIGTHATITGFVVSDYADRYGEAGREMAGWLADGSIASREHVEVGLDSFPDALVGLFEGRNTGKMLLDLTG